MSNRGGNTSRPPSSNGAGKVPPPMSGLPLRTAAAAGASKVPPPARAAPAAGLASKQPPYGTPAPAQAVASKLSDPNFKLKEQKAAKIVKILKNEDKKAYPKDANPEVRFGGRFIHNKTVGATADHNASFTYKLLTKTLQHIEKTHIFKLAQKAPKGAHLHIHLNACLVCTLDAREPGSHHDLSLY